MTSRPILSLLYIIVITATATAETPALPYAQPDALPSTLMCTPGELLFSEDFDLATVSDRWGFKADFALRDGALLRTDVDPTATKRVFLKDPSFHNTIIQFDFKLSGQTTDLRLVTGSGGHYNSVTQIRPGHFQVNTPVDRAAGIVPAQLGECICKALNDDPEFQTRNRAVVDAGRAITDYEHKAAPNLAQLAADSKAYLDSLKSSNER